VIDVVCSGLCYDYPGGVRALDGVDLAIHAGERVAIVGQNGSGKTTLIRHFNGLLRPTEGTVTVDGLDTRHKPVAALAALVGLAFQDPDRQIFAGSVEAEVSFGPRNLGRRGEELAAAVAGALRAVGLETELHTNPYDLGFSRRKLLSIASVLAMNTPVLVLDEPTTGQDAGGVRTIEAIVSSVAAKGRTVICASHDMRFVADNFERVVVMRDARLLLDGTPDEVFAERNWPTLRSTNLQTPYTGLVGAKLGLGVTPTEASLIKAISSDGGPKQLSRGRYSGHQLIDE
jgi:energy-coupling factor transport system ATP-binding protein